MFKHVTETRHYILHLSVLIEAMYQYKSVQKYTWSNVCAIKSYWLFSIKHCIRANEMRLANTDVYSITRKKDKLSKQIKQNYVITFLA